VENSTYAFEKCPTPDGHSTSHDRPGVGSRSGPEKASGNTVTRVIVEMGAGQIGGSMDASMLERFLRQYRRERIVDFSPITVGVSNQEFPGDLRIRQPFCYSGPSVQTIDSARAEALIQQAMISHGLSSPEYVRLADGEFVGQDRAGMFTIEEYIGGEHPARTSVALVRRDRVALRRAVCAIAMGHP
jgi:hypothetical protein